MINELASFRGREKLTQKDMASKLGITLTFYSKIEMGIRNPSYNFMVKFKNEFPDSDIDKIFFEE